MDNISKQADEIEVLSSIYGDEWQMECERSYSLDLSEGGKDVTLFFHLPDDYPSEAPPSCEMSAPSLSRQQKKGIQDALNEVYLENLGETVLYQWIEKVRSILQSLPDKEHIEVKKEAAFIVLNQAILDCPKIIHGDVIEDRRSHFQAHVAVVKTPEEVNSVIWTLKSERKIADATHNIVAWRCGVHHDCDDDGEKAAGPRLLRMLCLANLDNTVVVVTRWYGGIHLGPDRFRHINNAARQAFIKAGLLSN